MYKSTTVTILAVIFALAALPSYADDKDVTIKAVSQAHQGRGIVNKLNLDAGKVNISHEAIDSLKWPKMTMDFNVSEKSSLVEVKPGMKVEFELVKFADGFRITKISQAKE